MCSKCGMMLSRVCRWTPGYSDHNRTELPLSHSAEWDAHEAACVGPTCQEPVHHVPRRIWRRSSRCRQPARSGGRGSPAAPPSAATSQRVLLFLREFMELRMDLAWSVCHHVLGSHDASSSSVESEWKGSFEFSKKQSQGARESLGTLHIFS